VKVFTEETNLRATLLLDCSASMDFTGDPDRPTKKAYASYLAAALSYMMLGQSDSAGLVLFAQKIRKRIPPRSRRTHLNAILTALQANKPAGQTNLADVLHRVAETTTRRGLVILISDLLDDEADIYKGLSHLKYLNHDVIIFHTMDHQELNLDYEGLIQFEDLESNAMIRTFPQSLGESPFWGGVCVF